MRSESFVRNVFSNWIVLGANLVYSFAITPIVVNTLEKEAYGIWSFLNGLIAYSELFYLGLGSALIKYVAQYRSQADRGKLNRLVSVVLTIYSVLGLTCFAVFLLLSGAVPRLFGQPLSPAVAHAAELTCALLGARMGCVFVASAFAGLIHGHDRFDLVNLINLSSVVVRFVATPLVLTSAAEPLSALAWLTVIVGGLETLAMAGLAFLSVPGLSLGLARPRAAELSQLYRFGLQSFFILVAVKLIHYTDTTVIGVMLGASSVALYSLPLQLVDYSRVFVGGFSGVFLPRLVTLAAASDPAGLRSAYLRAMRIGCFLAGWLVATLIALGVPFITRWVGAEFGAPARWVIVFLAVSTFGQLISIHLPLPFYQSMHLMAWPAVVLFVEALANLGLSVWLVRRLGITGVALATALPSFLISVVVLPPYLCRKLSLPLTTLLRRGLAPGVLVSVASLATHWALDRVMPGDSYLALFGRALATVPVALAVFGVSFPNEERRVVWRALGLSDRITAAGPLPEPGGAGPPTPSDRPPRAPDRA